MILRYKFFYGGKKNKQLFNLKNKNDLKIKQVSLNDYN